MPRLLPALIALASLLITSTPALAQEWEKPQPMSQMDQAAQRVRTYLATVPRMPKDILVIPAAGDIAWPGTAPSDNVRAEVWLVVPRDNPKAKPLMMFAVRPGTGEVFALFLDSLQKNPNYKAP